MNKFYEKFKVNWEFSLSTTKDDFNHHFKNNVDYQNIHFFSSPIQKKSLNQYCGFIIGNSFNLKKVSYINNSGVHFEVCKGNIVEENNKLKIIYEINGLQGIIYILLIIYFVFLLFTFKDGFSFPSISFFLFGNYVFYRIAIKETITDIIDFKENFERDVKNWFQI